MSDSSGVPASVPVQADSKPLPAWLVPALFVCGLMAAIVSEPVIAANKERFTTATGLPPFPPELMWRVFWDNLYNHTICYGFVGLVTSGLICAAVGLSVNVSRAVFGLVVGALVGVVVGSALGIFGWFLAERVFVSNNIDSLLEALLIFIPFWVVLGFAVCCVALLACRRLDLLKHAIQPSIVYGVAAVICYVGIATLVFPSDWPGRIIPEFARLRIVLGITGCLGIAAAVLATLRKQKMVPIKA